MDESTNFTWANISNMSPEAKGKLLELGLAGYNVIDLLVLSELLKDHPEIDPKVVCENFINESTNNKS